MSHNTHYIIINAVDEESANLEVENTLTNFGDENNWYSIRRTVDLDNLTDEDTDYLNRELKDLNNELSIQKYEQLKSYIDKIYPQASEKAGHLFWQVSQYCKTLYELSKHVNKEPYTISDLKDINDYYGCQYDEYGITNLYYDDHHDEHVFFIEIDMHS